MNPIQTLFISVRALLRNKMRSFLTTLGVVIGVGAVIAMVAIGEGAKASVSAQFAAMGTDLLIVMSGSSTASGARGGAGSAPTLTWEDVKALRTQVRSVRYVAPNLRSNGQVVSEEQNWMAPITGTTPEYFSIRTWPATKGTLFTQSDVDTGTKVVVLGQTVANNLFGADTNPVGQLVRINNIPFEVVAVAASKGQSAQGQDYDDVVFVPSSTFQAKIQGGLQKFVAGSLFIGADPALGTAAAQREITELLRERHQIRPGAPDDFTIRNLSEMANAQQEGTETMTTLLASIAAVSLLVGGIGIMNIMLVSVTERTREIGVRMAVGAKPRHILAQFLVESLTLSLLGGLLGVVLGTISAQQLASRFGWTMLIRVDVTVVAVGFSAFVGVVFGLYPAYKASRLDPIQALRFE
ncbi:ABC transporter permease [Chondromyces apiculatus]|uniref:Macrolide export ATP-binding/permease protein MacB n=1 Tax=Chondromyces apiculatus DSM 436 TaxID=1192034 RepID=A0A017T6T5_9BACT|nr:ABC transporter permease [Chondromyces apiculatus]EYF04722.1 Macrolide export ATP-binding/permease protein MacB [Chondromyces apiculatus DSM 436]